MASRLAILIASLLTASSAFAIDVGTLVTKENRERMGLDYDVSAVQENAGAVIVALTVEKKGKLKDLHRVQLQISDGKRILLSVPLETEKQANGSLRVSFQLLADLADKAALCLYTEVSTNGPAFASHYAIPVRDYVVSKR